MNSAVEENEFKIMIQGVSENPIHIRSICIQVKIIKEN